MGLLEIHLQEGCKLRCGDLNSKGQNNKHGLEEQ